MTWPYTVQRLSMRSCGHRAVLEENGLASVCGRLQLRLQGTVERVFAMYSDQLSRQRSAGHCRAETDLLYSLSSWILWYSVRIGWRLHKAMSSTTLECTRMRSAWSRQAVSQRLLVGWHARCYPGCSYQVVWQPPLIKRKVLKVREIASISM